MELNEKSMLMASEALLRVGNLIFKRTTHLVSKLFGENLLFQIGESNLRASAGFAVARVCRMTGLLYDEEDRLQQILLDRYIITSVHDQAKHTLPDFTLLTDEESELSALIACWVVRNASLPEDADSTAALEQLDPLNWSESLRSHAQRNGSAAGTCTYSAELFREIPEGQVCLMHWYAEMLKRQEAQICAVNPQGLVLALKNLVRASK